MTELAPIPSPAPEQPPFAKTRYTGAVMICEQCEKRSSGPSKLKAKKLRGPFKDALGDARLRLRIVQTSCLGLCPKKAIAVAAVTPQAGSVLAAVRRKRDVPALAAGLLGPAAPTIRQG